MSAYPAPRKSSPHPPKHCDPRPRIVDGERHRERHISLSDDDAAFLLDLFPLPPHAITCPAQFDPYRPPAGLPPHPLAARLARTRTPPPPQPALHRADSAASSSRAPADPAVRRVHTHPPHPARPSISPASLGAGARLKPGPTAYRPVVRQLASPAIQIPEVSAAAQLPECFREDGSPVTDSDDYSLYSDSSFQDGRQHKSRYITRSGALRRGYGRARRQH